MSIIWIISLIILAGVSSSPVDFFRSVCDPTSPSPPHHVPRFPKNASDYNLTIPNDLRVTLRYLAVGVGTQNYTCSLISGKPTWNSLGAMAQLRDISNTLEDPALVSNAAINPKAKISLTPYKPIAMHYFVPHEPLAAPGFFFEPSKKPCSDVTKEEFVIVSKIGAMSSPNHPERNVPWLALKQIEGDAAQIVFRTDTHLGVAPSPQTCLAEGKGANMRYSALYWFYD
ncbi:uncharacterized protein MELLADRAFT_124322 [Melampsora larici-populina 98AG31]|uniref:Secreted protein n=1 Tax=Melampsora larici-populina (strain 98AG31 / pathotype 3-4-7) TaxID=747676 RepID=F4R7I3_MELLP|nr:uncharacterized protein MELLADRAFT_124322 [Melampsora larici-populina 98AG31]EGG11783.1 hypothetical protein MELLADRAFT_124322 [Melampsora larici-populina 98AG31]